MVKNKKELLLEKNAFWLWVSTIMFILFSAVLFINNLSDLLTKFGIPSNINLVSWIGIIGSIMWVIFLIIHRKELF